MPKKIHLKTFTSNNPIVTRDHEALGLHSDISDNEILRGVLVRVIPLNWIYMNGKSLSNLFREFRIAQDKYQGSLLLDVMFDAFWSDFKWKIFSFCFLPYLLYFVVAVAYLLLMLFEPGEEAPDWEFMAEDLTYLDTTELPLRIVFIVLWLFHFAVQVK